VDDHNLPRGGGECFHLVQDEKKVKNDGVFMSVHMKKKQASKGVFMWLDVKQVMSDCVLMSADVQNVMIDRVFT